ncbi:apiosidase-like domain-containing protein [Hespellia stercorisuis]|uniref:Apiosidase-like catalytic domain-containing protein n=1 Tax=Hespellia stercorisuis DSM 15480 TaxID=1121950 RepID=A0A1M6MHH6_9FIRM|nr:DUF4038 domain-containing protein [Hespellia stercorisuis]SHJ82898.1 Protein of unknown function [Hespellia stercorisuis DSM 15480]
MLKVDKNKSNFISDDKPFFYLADTIWSAFTNVTIEEWEYYLEKRKAQGFTVLQINTLPQWDRCMTDVGVYPFPTSDGGQTFTYGAFCQEYYDRARIMCRMAVDRGFHLALVVLWLNYVPGTWGSRIVAANVMPEDFLPVYTQKVVEEFDEFDPLYIVSGDTDFDTEEAVRYYGTVLNGLCELSPDSLKGMHIKRGYDVLPEHLLDQIDFYMFQSGHNQAEQDMAYILPESMREKYPKKPMLNSEPCYEQMGYSRKVYGRFSQFDVRKAAWTSILSGACAGVTYGAHGIWNWHEIGKPKNPVLGEGFDEALPWEDALALPGAWDYGFIHYLMERYGVSEIEPLPHLILNDTRDIRMGRNIDGDYLIYVPSNTNVRVQADLSGYRIRITDLTTRNTAFGTVKTENGVSTIQMHSFPEDVLIAAIKE